MQKQVVFKVVLIGDSGVGKTTLLHRLVSNEFTPNLASTISAGISEWATGNGDHKINIRIWDTAGQEMFRSICSLYFRNAHAAILVVAHNTKLDYANLKSWCDSFREIAGQNVPIILAGSKYDLASDDSKIEMKKMAENLNIPCCDTSAKTGEGVLELFEYVAHSIYSMQDSDVFKSVGKCFRRCEKCEGCCK